MDISAEDMGDVLEQARIACADGEYGKASLLLTGEAEKGDAEALFLLGNIQLEGKGQVLLEQDGAQFLKKSADQGFLPAVYKVRSLNNKQISFFWKSDVEQKEVSRNEALVSETANDRRNFSTTMHLSKNGTSQNLRIFRDNIDITETSPELSSEEQNRLYSLAVGGEVSAMYELSVFLRHSPQKGDESSGLYWLGRAAQKGNLIAQYELGMYCLEGRRITKDLLQACLWFKRAAEKDYVPAIYALAKVYIDKSLGLYNPEEGVSLLKRIKQQSPEALILLARLCTTGDILPHDDKQAKIYLKQAVEGGSEQASLELARLLVEQKNYRDGIPLLIESAACNNLDALVLLADLYHKGLGVSLLEDKAAFLYYKAACMGSAEAQYKFAQISMNAASNEDKRRGRIWCRKSATKHYVPALYTLGLLIKEEADSKLGSNEDERMQKWKTRKELHDELYMSYKTAFELLNEAAEGGEAEAQYLVSEMYQHGLGTFENVQQSVAWCKRAALGGNISAQFRMAELYNHGEIFEPNLEQAAEWYRSAAGNGSIEAAYQLGLMYREGRGVVQSDAKAIRYFEQGCASNYAPAIRELGWHALNGVGCDIDRNKAEELFLRSAEQENEAAVIDLVTLYRDTLASPAKMDEAINLLTRMSDNGHSDCTYLLAECNFQGVGVEMNVERGLELLEKAASLNCSHAQYDLGQLYFDGNMVPRNYQKAVSYFKKAAEHKYDKAQYMVGKCARDGMGMLVNYPEALYFFKASAEQGYSLAYLALGEMYENGIGVISSLKEALHYYRLLAYSGYNDAFPLIADILLKGGGDVEATPEEAAQWLVNGVERGHSGCCYRLAQLHLSHILEKADTVTGIKLMNKAAELGNCEALFYLAKAHIEGKVIAANTTKAFFYCQKAAALNHVGATTLLGQMFLNGRGCERSTVMAFDLFSTSANMGDSEAQYELAKLFRNGDGVQQSFIDAYVWSILALTNGGQHEASVLRDDVALELTAGQLKEAQYIASERLSHIKPLATQMKRAQVYQFVRT